ncbi:hypothetical protein M9458_046059, partial [Cirrhinus mrigala]
GKAGVKGPSDLNVALQKDHVEKLQHLDGPDKTAEGTARTPESCTSRVRRVEDS